MLQVREKGAALIFTVCTCSQRTVLSPPFLVGRTQFTSESILMISHPQQMTVEVRMMIGQNAPMELPATGMIALNTSRYFVMSLKDWQTPLPSTAGATLHIRQSTSTQHHLLHVSPLPPPPCSMKQLPSSSLHSRYHTFWKKTQLQEN